MEHEAFDEIKRMVSKYILLAYTDINRRFDIHTDSSDYKLSTVTRQEVRTIDVFAEILKELRPGKMKWKRGCLLL